MQIELIPLISFVVVTTFTPGPNNISSASMGMLYGYKKTLNYLLGITIGFFLVMLICAYLSSALLNFVPSTERYLRWVGAGYILWLAVSILNSNPSNSRSDRPVMAFAKGFVLQLMNPKVAVYGLTLYSTFLASLSSRIDYLSVSAGAFALTAFAATSTWALFGAVIHTKLKDEFFRKILNLSLALLLVYTALELSGLLNFLKQQMDTF